MHLAKVLINSNKVRRRLLHTDRRKKRNCISQRQKGIHSELLFVWKRWHKQHARAIQAVVLVSAGVPISDSSQQQ